MSIRRDTFHSTRPSARALAMNAYVVTGAGRGIGRTIAQRLSKDGFVVALDRDSDALSWVEHGAISERVAALAGDATDDDLLERAAHLAAERGRLVGWVNNAAVFRDFDLHAASSAKLMALIERNLAPAVADADKRYGPSSRHPTGTKRSRLVSGPTERSSTYLRTKRAGLCPAR